MKTTSTKTGKKIVYYLLFLLVVLIKYNQISAQSYSSIIDNLTPQSPSAFQFLKYTKMPVNDYTGIPDITVPLYEIDVDEVKVPVSLSYHAIGIRVSQDASWVGLGWDLTFGSIIQTINKLDDFYGKNDPDTPYYKILPDYNLSYIPEEFPMRYPLMCMCSITRKEKTRLPLPFLHIIITMHRPGCLA